jgi:hypothetical protein
VQILGKRISGKGMIRERHPRSPHDHADKSRRHCGAGRLVRLALEAMVPAGWFVDTQDLITLATAIRAPDNLTYPWIFLVFWEFLRATCVSLMAGVFVGFFAS